MNPTIMDAVNYIQAWTDDTLARRAKCPPGTFTPEQQAHLDAQEKVIASLLSVMRACAKIDNREVGSKGFNDFIPKLPREVCQLWYNTINEMTQGPLKEDPVFAMSFNGMLNSRAKLGMRLYGRRVSKRAK